MKFVKLIDEYTIENAPRVLIDDEKVYSNPSEEILRAFGYKPLEETEMPVKEGYYYTLKYVDTGNTIKQVWEEHEVPEPDPQPEPEPEFEE